MTENPGSFTATEHGPIEWDDQASIHLVSDGDGLFYGLKSVHHGTLAEMVAMVSRMPEEDRSKYVIQKAGDHRLGLAEIMELAARADFPG